MTKILVDREVLQAAVEYVGAKYSSLTLEEWDEVAAGVFQYMLDQPDAHNREQSLPIDEAWQLRKRKC